MKTLGILLLCAGIILAIYALNMDVSVNVEAKDYGYGISSPAMKVANLDLMAQRQNFIILAGILAVVGAVLFGFGAMQEAALPSAPPTVQAVVAEGETAPQRPPSGALTEEAQIPVTEVSRTSQPQVSVSICPSCRFMGGGDDSNCGRCGAVLNT